MSTHLCGGFCCEKFSLSTSPEERERWVQAIRNGDKRWTDDSGKVFSLGTEEQQEDVIKVHEMVILIETDEDYIQPEGQRIKGKHSYTCKYFDKQSRLCTNYDNRPATCKNYPEGTQNKVCTYEGCKLNQ